MRWPTNLVGFSHFVVCVFLFLNIDVKLVLARRLLFYISRLAIIFIVLDMHAYVLIKTGHGEMTA